MQLELYLPAEPGLRLTDPDLLAQALTNVVANAVEATRSRPDARVSVTLAQGGGWRLLVTDNGAGVPLSDVEAIFVPMMTTKSGGSGLGLHLSRSALRSLGGDLTLLPCAGDRLTTFELIF